MSTTRKARGPIKEDGIDGHEERNIWNQIKGDLERCAQIQRRQKPYMNQIQALEEEFAKSPPSSAQIDELQGQYRELLKLTNEEQELLNDEPSEIMKHLDILIALRKASAQGDGDAGGLGSGGSSSGGGGSNIPARPQSSNKVRNKPKPKMEHQSGVDSPAAVAAAESPGPSPSFPHSRLKGSTQRSSPAASVRESKEIKIEEGLEGGNKGGPSAERAGRFVVGAEVAYKQNKMKEDGSQWIICHITEITQVGTKKRYQVQDPEPDDHGNPGEIYMASASSLIAIPGKDADLPDYPIGKAVLANYPETTTFYRAEVIANLRKGYCRLRFEDDQNKEMEVQRRFVLNIPS